MCVTVFYLNVFWMWSVWIFSIITPVFSVTRSFRNHYNMLICCSKNISYYKCWKQLLYILMNRKFKINRIYLRWKSFEHLKLLKSRVYQSTITIWYHHCTMVPPQGKDVCHLIFTHKPSGISPPLTNSLRNGTWDTKRVTSLCLSMEKEYDPI